MGKASQENEPQLVQLDGNNAEHNAHNGQWHDFHLTCHVNPFIPPLKQADGAVVVMPLHSQMSQNLMSKLFF